MLFDRSEHTGKGWHRMLTNVINQSTNTTHSSTKLKPVDAIRDKTAVEVKTNLILRARFKRKYKDIDIHDFVRIS